MKVRILAPARTDWPFGTWMEHRVRLKWIEKYGTSEKTQVLYNICTRKVILGLQKSFTRFVAFFFFHFLKSNKVQILINITTIDFYYSYSLPTIRQRMDPTAKKRLVFWWDEIVDYFSHFNFILKSLLAKHFCNERNSIAIRHIGIRL